MKLRRPGTVDEECETSTEQETINFQAHNHPLMYIDQFSSLEDYCLRLMHLSAYEEVKKRARNKRVLEVGCNTGYGTKMVSSVCREIVGVDLSESALKVARERYSAPNIDYRLVDGVTLPFADAEFELIITFQVIEHISNYDAYLGELKRVLTQDGMVIFTTPNARVRLDPGMKPWNAFHVREFSAEELHELLREWFANVEVLGLFATREVYNVEYGRVQRSLNEARRNSQRRIPAAWQIRSRIIDCAKSLLPEQAVGFVQGLVRSRRSRTSGVPARKKQLDPALRQRYSTKDFFYRRDNLESVLDLMAICSQAKS